jgi:hypothetical protein
VIEHVPWPVRRHIVSVPVGPDAVCQAREAMTQRFGEVGVASDSVFGDAVLLVVRELVTNVLRHAPRSPVANVGMTVGAGQLVVSVADAEPRLPDLEPGAMGAGLGWSWWRSWPVSTTVTSARNRPSAMTARWFLSASVCRRGPWTRPDRGKQ